ncbi:MAG: hypothetical protein COB46_08120 [Rhodospirillaceae bacterium]|nr:MAG: hypothetical protein COB46_08120 [Rhodospirillaceae bacterium]
MEMSVAEFKELCTYVETCVKSHINDTLSTQPESLCGFYNHYLSLRKPSRKFGSVELRRRLQSLVNSTSQVIDTSIDAILEHDETTKQRKLNLDKVTGRVLFYGIEGEDYDEMAVDFVSLASRIASLSPQLSAAWFMAAERCGNGLARDACRKIDEWLCLAGISTRVPMSQPLIDTLSVTLQLEDGQRKSLVMHEMIMHWSKDGLKNSKPDMLVKKMRDESVCAAEMKSAEHDKMYPEILPQIFETSIEENIFVDRCARIAVRCPRTAITYLWRAKQQGLKVANRAWLDLKLATFRTSDLGEAQSIEATLSIIEKTPKDIWSTITSDVINTNIVNKQYLLDTLTSTVKQPTAKESDVQLALNGDVTQTCHIIQESLRAQPADAYLLLQFHVFEKRNVFEHLYHSMRTAWHACKVVGIQNPGDEKASFTPNAVPDGKIVVASDLPNDLRIDGKLSTERRNTIRRFGALGTGIDITDPILTPDELQNLLMLEFPWMEKTITVIHRDMTVRRSFGQSAFLMPPLLLVGPPGTGKTRFTMRLAELVGVPYSALSLAGASDDRMLQGTGSGWGNAQPSYPVIKMNDNECANVVILLDEIDKCKADGRNGDPHASLLSMLEPESARNYHDDALMCHVNISMVNWIATANDISHMPMPLLSRFRVIEVPTPSSKDIVAIIGGVRSDFAAEVGCDVRFVPHLDEAEIMYLEREFKKRPDVRVLIRMVERLIVRREALDRKQPH